MRLQSFVSILCSTVLIATLALADTAPKPPTYWQVRAILNNRCLSCHDAKEAESDLVMETYESLMKGGEKGRDVLPGNANESRLIQQIERRAKPFMPPPKKAEKLPEIEIALIRAWIDAGAPGPKAGEVVAIAPTTQPVAKITPKVAVRRPILSLAYEPKMNVVAAARPGEVEIWSVEQQGIAHRFRNLAGVVNAITFSADGTKLFAAGGDPGAGGRIWIWSVPDWKPIRTLEGHTDAIYSIAVSPDGKTLATGSYDQKIALWDLAAALSAADTLTGGSDAHKNAGKGTGGPPSLGQRPSDSKSSPRMLIGHNGAVFGVAFRPDGKVLASVSADRTLKLWDVATGNRLDTRPEPVKDLYGLAWSPDGSRVAAGGVDNRIRIWKVSPSAVEGTNAIEFAKFAHDGTILRIAWSPDGKFILSGADNGTLRLFNAVDMKQKLTFAAQSDWPSALTFAEGSKLAIVGRLDGSISFYETETGRELAPPAPVLTSASPRGIERGHASRVKLTGKNLLQITSVKLAEMSDRRITARLLPDATAGLAVVEITTPADAALEPISLSVAGPGGTTLPVKVYVDNLPQRVMNAESASANRPEVLPAPSSTWGVFMTAGTIDHFAVDAKKGQTLVFDVAAKRLGSKSQILLVISSAAGRILATGEAKGDDVDPLVAFKAPAHGRYLVKVSDATATGTGKATASIDNFYRLSVGEFGYVTGTFPLAVPAEGESKVQLLGHNLPENSVVMVKPAAGQTEVNLPLDSAHFRSRRPLKVVVSTMPELIEVEPNDTPKQAMHLPVPSSVNGRIDVAGDADLYQFEAKAGMTYAVETMAAQRGSPVDTKIQVLHADGRPVQRLQFRAVRDSNVTFRGFDANDVGCRFPNYQEMDLDQYVYLNGEVVRLFNYPQGPDSNFFFYLLNGKRRCYFDTTATAHALDEKCYVVEPHPVGEKLLPNGLPVIPLYYENDDDSDRLLGTDSRLLFTAPADGKYLVRVTDTRNFGGSDYVYRLTVRPAQPDFTATIVGYDSNPPAGSGRDFTVKLNRIDGFDGPVKIEISDPPAGFMISFPVIVEAGQWDAQGTLYAMANAPTTMPAASAAGLKVTASAIIDGKTVSRALPDLKHPSASTKSQVQITLEPVVVSPASSAAGATPIDITPGKLTPVMLRVQRNGFTKALSFDGRNLPHGIVIADIGLNGVQILEGQSERQIFIQCAPGVAQTTRPFYMRVREIGSPTSAPIMLRVQRGETEKASR